jgi:two-component system, LuxR family, sensor kinase FixL
MPVRTELKIYIGLCVALALVAAMGVVGYQSIARLREAAQLESHTFEVLYHIADVQAASNDLEIGRRGYLLTGQEQFLTPYRTGLPRLKSGLDELRRAVADNAEQHKRALALVPLMRQREQLLEESIALKHLQPAESVRQDAITVQLKEAHDQVRSLLTKMTEQERRLLDQRVAQADESGSWALNVIIGVNVGAVLLLGLAAFIIQRDLIARRRAAEALQHAYDDLGLQHQSRASELGHAIDQVRQEIQRRADAEASLRDTERRTSSILSTVVDGVITINEAGQVLSFNPAAERIFGYRHEEVLGKNVNMLMPAPYAAEHDAYIQNYTRTGVKKIIGIGREVEGRRQDGTVFPVDLAVSETKLDHERIFTGVVRDITERRRAQEALRRSHRDLEHALKALQARTDEAQSMAQQLWQAAKLATVGELAASIAHELNNPLATVSLRVEGLLAQTPGDDPKRRLLEIIEQEVERMGLLVSNLLQFSRRGQDQVSSVNVHDELDKAVELIQHQLRQRKIEVVRLYARGLPFVFADRQKIRQVLLNLFTNANDAMKHGGTLTLRTGTEVDGDGRKAVRVEVGDTGHGIAPENLKRVMEPFFTTKEEGKGTGLGLAICRRIVQEHHGTLEIDSKPGQGTTVRIVLPVSNGRPQEI